MDNQSALEKVWEEYWNGAFWIDPTNVETTQCKRETREAHQRHLIFAQGFYAALQVLGRWINTSYSIYENYTFCGECERLRKEYNAAVANSLFIKAKKLANVLNGHKRFNHP